MRQKLILDVDTGTDDAVALMLAALHPDLELVAATTVNGNSPVGYCTENTLRVFEYIGVDVPVYEGLARPIVRPDFPLPRHEQAEEHHGQYLEIPAARTKKQPDHAVDFLIDTYMSTTDEILLVPVGPLSNVAMALTKEPRIADAIPAMVIMGGGNEIGNVTPSAEFNIWADPEAARVVMNSGVPMTLVPLDATHRAMVSRSDCEKLRALGTPAAVACAIFMEHRIRWYDETQQLGRLGAGPLHDALCVASIVDRSVISTRHVHVDIEVHGELTVGRTVIDTPWRSRREQNPPIPNVDVAYDADEAKFVKFLLDTFAPSK